MLAHPLARAALRPLLALAALAAPPIAARGADPAPGPPPRALTVVDRVITQDRVQSKRVNGVVEQFSYWQVDYRLRNDGPTGLIVTPSDVSGRVEGWVSNSRIDSHAAPRRAAQVLQGPTGLSAFAEVIESADESRRCRERAALRVWPNGESAPDLDAEPAADGPILSLPPGGVVRARLRLEHHHFLYGSYDPLLGPRAVDLRLGSAALKDTLPLDRGRRTPRPALTWPRPPADRMDTRHFVSAPDSLHLEAHVLGNHQYRFDDQPVPYATRMRLRYWYLIAPGTRGECRARVVQYRDAPTAWKVLADGTRDETLAVVGRWTRVERTFGTEADATSLALDFRIVGADIGELWIDNVTLEPVDADPCGP